MAVSIDTLRALPLFSSAGEEELAQLARMFAHREVSAGTALTVEGASGYTFFVIESGMLNVERDGKLLETLGPGDFFGEAAIISGERRNASVTAASDVGVLVLFGTEYRRLEAELPDVAAKIDQKMAERAARISQDEII